MVETLIAAAVLLLVVPVLVHFMFMGRRGYDESLDASVLQGTARKAMLSMLSELQESRKIEYPRAAPAGPCTDSRAVVRNGKYEQIEYAFEDGVIKRYNRSVDDPRKRERVLVENVKELHFTRVDDRLLNVRVVVVTDGKDPDQRRESQIVTSFFLRNKL